MSDTCQTSCTAVTKTVLFLGEKEQQKLIPWGGVATRLGARSVSGPQSVESAPRDQSHVFCSLPVTLSGLPAHVNGCFELSASRTSLSWHEYAHKDRWNRHVLAAVVSRAYGALLLDCQELLVSVTWHPRALLQ